MNGRFFSADILSWNWNAFSRSNNIIDSSCNTNADFSMLGGYGNFGGGSYATKTFNIPIPHYAIEVFFYLFISFFRIHYFYIGVL